MPQWSPDVSECIPVWGIIPLLLAPPPPRYIPTSRPTHVLRRVLWDYGSTNNCNKNTLAYIMSGIPLPSLLPPQLNHVFPNGLLQDTG